MRVELVNVIILFELLGEFGPKGQLASELDDDVTDG